MTTATETPTTLTTDPVSQEKGKAKQAVQETREEMKSKAKEVFAKARESAKHRADDCVNATGGKIRNLEQASAKAREEMQGNQPDFLITGMELLTDRIASVADYFDHKDSRDIADDVSGLVRRHPGATLGALAVAGFCAGRFLKAGHPEEESHPSAGTAHLPVSS